jgi:hypothetical protein
VIDRVQLTLLAGPVLPLPVPSDVVQALRSAQVTVQSGARSGFQLVFAISKRSSLSTTLIPAGAFDPGIRVVLVATVNGMPNVLMDGVITRQEVGVSDQIGQSALTITGEDLTVLMDLDQRTGEPFPPMSAMARVGWILKGYLLYGIVPLLVPELFPDVPVPTQHIEFKDGTDLEYIQKLAKENGYVFYLDPGPVPGASRAYFGPEIRIGVPQPALNVDMDAMTNVQSLSFSFDGLQRTQVTATVQEPISKLSVSIPLPEVSLLAPPLALRQAPSLRTKPLEGAAKDNPLAAMAKGLAAVSESADAVTATGQLDVARYGRVLSPRGLVGVRGAGLAYDGLYYVKSVTHDLSPGSYTQSFSLSRNGLVPLTGVVVP